MSATTNHERSFMGAGIALPNEEGKRRRTTLTTITTSKNEFMALSERSTSLLKGRKRMTIEQRLQLLAKLPSGVKNKENKTTIAITKTYINEDEVRIQRRKNLNESIEYNDNAGGNTHHNNDQEERDGDEEQKKIENYSSADSSSFKKEGSNNTAFDSPSNLYWNLSCPLEMSMFAGSHMEDPTKHLNTSSDSNNYWSRAIRARDLVLSKRVWEQIQKQFTSPEIKNKEGKKKRPIFIGRKVIFVGDSTMRQIFISLACLSWNHVESYTIAWYDEHRRRKSRTQQPNTVDFGPHSKFEEARIRFRYDYHNRESEGIEEIIYHHGIGKLLQLGTDYTSREIQSNDWLQNAASGKMQLSATVPTLPRYLAYTLALNDVYTTSTKRTKIPKKKEEKARLPVELPFSDRNVTHEQLRLGPLDVVLVNGSVHGNVKRNLNIQNIQQFLQHVQMKQLQDSYPTFAYVMTGVSHFPTDNGIYDPHNLLVEKRQRIKSAIKNGDSKESTHIDDNNQECIASTLYHELQRDEISRLHDKITILGRSTLPLQLESGNLHVGGQDCLHWMQPGIPDILAAEVSNFVTSLSS